MRSETIGTTFFFETLPCFFTTRDLDSAPLMHVGFHLNLHFRNVKKIGVRHGQYMGGLPLVVVVSDADRAPKSDTSFDCVEMFEKCPIRGRIGHFLLVCRTFACSSPNGKNAFQFPAPKKCPKRPRIGHFSCPWRTPCRSVQSWGCPAAQACASWTFHTQNQNLKTSQVSSLESASLVTSCS